MIRQICSLTMDFSHDTKFLKHDYVRKKIIFLKNFKATYFFKNPQNFRNYLTFCLKLKFKRLYDSYLWCILCVIHIMAFSNFSREIIWFIKQNIYACCLVQHFIRKNIENIKNKNLYKFWLKYHFLLHKKNCLTN